MKKMIILLLTAVLTLSLGITAYADEKTEAGKGEPEKNEAEEGGTERAVYADNGIAIDYPEEFDQDLLKGIFSASPKGVLPSFGVGVVSFYYLAIPMEEMDAISLRGNGEYLPEDMEYLSSKYGDLGTLYSIDGGRSLEDFLAMEQSADIPADEIYELGKAEDVSFFYHFVPEEKVEEYLKSIAPAYQEEYQMLKKDLEEVLKNAEFFVPIVPGGGLVGSTLDFETEDLDGNKVKGSDIFAKNKITMINFWTTWCGNCLNEMADLVEINKRLAEKDVEIIGICIDADTKLEACKAIVEEYKIDFPILLPFEGLEYVLEIPGFPTSYFVDSEGTILSVPYVGAPMDRSNYETFIDSLLNGEEPVQDNPSPVAANDGETYRVIVSDENGDPLKGTTVQFCSDSMCMFGKTDENGVAEFAQEKGVYKVHILKAPEGYVKPVAEFETSEDYCDVCFTLQKAE